jgi:parallel beta-helix repeat protein
MLPPLLLGPARSTFAADGVTLIKQTSTTVFPIKITMPGSYRLASDLTVMRPTADAIDITADDVTLDLNGFSIIGPGAGSGIGINGAAFNASVVTVTNGAITRMGFGGVALGADAHIEGVRAVANGPHAFVGIVAGQYSRIVGNVANNNVGPVAEEAAVGIFCAGSCLISGNTANHNYKGIVTSSGSLVLGNSASGNRYGLDLSPAAGYGKNVMENNRNACVNPVDGGASTGDNVCSGVLE